jgi:hypothetical protein
LLRSHQKMKGSRFRRSQFRSSPGAREDNLHFWRAASNFSHSGETNLAGFWRLIISISSRDQSRIERLHRCRSSYNLFQPSMRRGLPSMTRVAQVSHDRIWIGPSSPMAWMTRPRLTEVAARDPVYARCADGDKDPRPYLGAFSRDPCRGHSRSYRKVAQSRLGTMPTASAL